MPVIFAIVSIEDETGIVFIPFWYGSEAQDKWMSINLNSGSLFGLADFIIMASPEGEISHRTRAITIGVFPIILVDAGLASREGEISD